MKSIIKIERVDNIYKFVEQACKVDGDVLLQRGKISVDGKSLLGIISIDPSEAMVVEHPDTAVNFQKFLEKYEA